LKFAVKRIIDLLNQLINIRTLLYMELFVEVDYIKFIRTKFYIHYQLASILYLFELI